MRWAWFVLAVVVVALGVAAGLYAAGPERQCRHTHTGQKYPGAPIEDFCDDWGNSNVWERISGAVSGD